MQFLISIHPGWSKEIFDHLKGVEYRRSIPKRLARGDRGYIYTARPVSALQGGFTVKDVISGPPSLIWSQTHNLNSPTMPPTMNIFIPRYFTDYFADATIAHAIILENVWRFDPEISLATLREDISGFHPPQSWCYLTESMHKTFKAYANPPEQIPLPLGEAW